MSLGRPQTVCKKSKSKEQNEETQEHQHYKTFSVRDLNGIFLSLTPTYLQWGLWGVVHNTTLHGTFLLLLTAAPASLSWAHRPTTRYVIGELRNQAGGYA